MTSSTTDLSLGDRLIPGSHPTLSEAIESVGRTKKPLLWLKTIMSEQDGSLNQTLLPEGMENREHRMRELGQALKQIDKSDTYIQQLENGLGSLKGERPRESLEKLISREQAEHVTNMRAALGTVERTLEDAEKYLETKGRKPSLEAAAALINVKKIVESRDLDVIEAFCITKLGSRIALRPRAVEGTARIEARDIETGIREMLEGRGGQILEEALTRR
jgi:phosphopantetheine adenylyltransferase